MPFIAQRIDQRHVNPEPEEIYDDWEDVTDNHGEPEVLLLNTVWVVRAERDKPWHGHNHNDPILLITRCRE